MERDQRECCCLHLLTNCPKGPEPQELVRVSARLPRNETEKVQHYYLSVRR